MTCATIIFMVGLSVGKTGLYILPFAGAFVAFFWPTFIVTCMRYWGADAAVPISVILPVQALLGIIIQLILGWLNDTFGHSCAYWSTVPVILAALVLFVFYHLMVLRKEKSEKQQNEQLLPNDIKIESN